MARFNPFTYLVMKTGPQSDYNNYARCDYTVGLDQRFTKGHGCAYDSSLDSTESLQPSSMQCI